MNKIPLLLAAAAASFGTVLGIASISGAQTFDGLDLAQARTRAVQHAADAEALSAEVARRGASLRAEAGSVAAGAFANSARHAAEGVDGRGQSGRFDFDAMVKAAPGTAAADQGESAQFIAFASLSMPPVALRQLLGDVSRAGGVVVFRGFPNNNVKAFTAGLARVAGAGPLDNVGIDPRLFRAFEIVAVPTYVVTTSAFDLCNGFDCRTQLPPHDRIAGNVSTEYALTTFASGGGPGAGIARLHLNRLGQERGR